MHPFWPQQPARHSECFVPRRGHGVDENTRLASSFATTTLTGFTAEYQTMTMILDQRAADTSTADIVWQGRSERDGAFISVAAPYWELVVTRHPDGQPLVTIKGPETRPRQLNYQRGSTWCGIRFKLGAHLQPFAHRSIVDTAITLPTVSDRAFVLAGTEIPIPDVETAEDTLGSLIRTGMLQFDPLVERTWHGIQPQVSQRTCQRRFRQVTGISHRTAQQISRARTALHLLQNGTSILDTVAHLGFSDQAHLTRSLHRWMGCTPGRVVRHARVPT
jgi:hypothetical protein